MLLQFNKDIQINLKYISKFLPNLIFYFDIYEVKG